MPAVAVRVLSQQQSVRGYRRGTTLFKEGQLPRGLAVLCQGRVKLSVGGNGHEEILRVAGPGEVIGLSATVSGNQHQEKAKTTTNSRLVFIGRNRLLRYLRTHTQASIRVVEFLSEDVQAAEGRLRRLSQDRVKYLQP